MTTSTQDLHAAIMNLPCKPYDGTTTYDAYCRGHRDARQAAAELAAASLPAAARCPGVDERAAAWDAWHQEWQRTHNYPPKTGDSFDAGYRAAWKRAQTLPAQPAAPSVNELRQGNWSHPDGGRIVGWHIPADAVERIGADAFCLPREVAECLARLTGERPAAQPAAPALSDEHRKTVQDAIDALMECDRDGDYPLIERLESLLAAGAAPAPITDGVQACLSPNGEPRRCVLWKCHEAKTCARGAASASPAPSAQPDAKPDLARAADFLEQYADFIRRDVMSVDIERHPYLPELEEVAQEIRAAVGRSASPSRHAPNPDCECHDCHIARTRTRGASPAPSAQAPAPAPTTTVATLARAADRKALPIMRALNVFGGNVTLNQPLDLALIGAALCNAGCRLEDAPYAAPAPAASPPLPEVYISGPYTVGANAGRRSVCDLATGRVLGYLSEGALDVAVAAPAASPAGVQQNERYAFTVVFRGLTDEERRELIRHPKGVVFSYSHAIYDRDEARAALQSAGAPQAAMDAAQQDALYEAIKHGDDAHRAWLRAAIKAHFAGEALPPYVAGAPQAPSGVDALWVERAKKLANALSVARYALGSFTASRQAYDDQDDEAARLSSAAARARDELDCHLSTALTGAAKE